MEYNELLEKIKEHIAKKYLFDEVTISVDNSKIVKVTEMKQNKCVEGEGCHMDPDENLELNCSGSYEGKLCPNDTPEEIETSLYRVELFCEGRRIYDERLSIGMAHPKKEDVSFICYRAFVAVDDEDNTKIHCVCEEVNDIFTFMDKKVYEQWKLPENPDDKESCKLQAFVLDDIGITTREPAKTKDNNGYTVWKVEPGYRTQGIPEIYSHTNRSGSLYTYTYDDSTIHIHEYKGNYGGKSAIESNVFFTFEDHTIHKYTIETSVENENDLYNGKVKLKDEIYYEIPWNEYISGLEVVHMASKYPIKCPVNVMRYNPIIISDTIGRKYLMIKDEKGEPIISEKFRSLELKDEIKESVLTEKVCFPFSTITEERECGYVEDEMEFIFTDTDDKKGSVYLVGDHSNKHPSIVKHMELKAE